MADRKPSTWDRLEDETERQHYKRVNRMLEARDVLRRERIDTTDPDFAEKVSGYMSGEVDPSIARYHDLGLSDNDPIILKGEYWPESYDPKTVEKTYEGRPITWNREPGTVAAFHTHNTPYVYGHEYRHKNYPHLSERQNRRVDLVAAQSPHDVDMAVRMWADEEGGGVPSTHIPSVADTLRHLRVFDNQAASRVISENTGKDVDDVIEASAMREFVDDAAALDEYNEGLSERNKKRRAGEPETVADSLRAVIERLGL